MKGLMGGRGVCVCERERERERERGRGEGGHTLVGRKVCVCVCVWVCEREREREREREIYECRCDGRLKTKHVWGTILLDCIRFFEKRSDLPFRTDATRLD
jgi:hypothetical protein